MPTDRLFTGQRLDSTGLYYYGARYYDPEIGRFISADPVVQDYANPQSLNRYSYVFNNPLKYTDPSGLIVEFENEDYILMMLEELAYWGMDYAAGSLFDQMVGDWANDRLEWEEFSEEHTVLAGFLEDSETVFQFNGAISRESLRSVPDDAIGLISNLVARAWAASNTYSGLRFAEETGGSSFRVAPGGVLVFEGIDKHSDTGKYMSLIGGNPVTFGDVVLTTDLTVSLKDLTHEYGHVYQYSLLGPYFLPLYGLDSLLNFRTDSNSWWNNKSMETFYIPGWAKIK